MFSYGRQKDYLNFEKWEKIYHNSEIDQVECNEESGLKMTI